MLNIDSIENGLVLDHIKAGNSMGIYHYMNLDKLDCTVAIIKNVKSNRMGRKDIIKIENALDIDLDMLGFIDKNITVNIISGGKIIEKANITLPKEVVNIVKCKNPRCITAVEQELSHKFRLTDATRGIYRCIYCEQAADTNE